MAITGVAVALAIFVGLVVLFLARWMCIRRTSTRLQPEASVLLEWDDTGACVRYPEGRVVTVRWDSLSSVRICTTDEGPWRPDVFWLLTDVDGVVLIAPQGATGEDGFLQELERRLSGFDDREVIKAMGSTDNAVFTLWEPASGEPGSATLSAAQ
jgi:hypothetical protein